MTKLLTKREAAEYLSVTERTLQNLDIPKIRLSDGPRSGVRYEVRDLDRWKRKNKRGKNGESEHDPEFVRDVTDSQKREKQFRKLLKDYTITVKKKGGRRDGQH